MSETCCFISFFDELDAANGREKERLEFVLSGALFYLTYAKDVKDITVFWPEDLVFWE